VKRTLPGIAAMGLLAMVFWLLACGSNNAESGDRSQLTPLNTGNEPVADNAQENPKEEPVKPAQPVKPKPMSEVPAGEVTDEGLRWSITFERGEGYAVFARQNDMLRVDLDVRLPYSGGDGQASRGSCVDLVLSVDGLHGRHLFFYPNPVWMPDGRGNFTAYRIEYSFDKNEAQPMRLQDEPSFVGSSNVRFWDHWKATIWVDLRYVLIPGNTPTSRADNWLAGLVLGNEAATQVFPEGMDVQNPGKTSDRLFSFKYSTLPELEEEDESPRDELLELERKVHEAQRNIEARFTVRDNVGAFKALVKASEDFPDLLWGHYLAYMLSYTAAMRGIEGIDAEFLKYQRAYVEICPGQSSAHLDYLRNLLPRGKNDEAFAHAKTIFDSPLCTGRPGTDGYMRLKWTELCIPWGLTKEAAAQLEYIKGKPELLKDDNFRVDYNFQRAEYAIRTGDAKAAVEIYTALMKDERKFLNTNQFGLIQQNLQFQRQAAEQWEEELKFQAEDAKKTNPRWVVETSRGKIVIELFEDDSPNTVASLVKLAKNKFYDGLNFHRVEPNFVAQGGCPNGDGTGGPGYQLKFEENRRGHFRGTVAMARSQSKDSAGCQFYICTANSPNVLSLTGNYVVVGRVVEGMDVADMLRVGDKIVSIRAENLREHDYEPKILPE